MDTRQPANYQLPTTPQGKAALKYVLASQKACPSSEWEEIIRVAVADAKDASSPKVRSDARNFLARVLMPRDPVQFLQVFAPQHSVEEIRNYLRDLQEMKSRLDILDGSSNGNGGRIHDVIPSPDSTLPSPDEIPLPPSPSLPEGTGPTPPG